MRTWFVCVALLVTAGFSQAQGLVVNGVTLGQQINEGVLRTKFARAECDGSSSPKTASSWHRCKVSLTYLKTETTAEVYVRSDGVATQMEISMPIHLLPLVERDVERHYGKPFQNAASIDKAGISIWRPKNENMVVAVFSKPEKKFLNVVYIWGKQIVADPD